MVKGAKLDQNAFVVLSYGNSPFWKETTQLRLVNSAEVLIITSPFYSVLTFFYTSEHVYPKTIYRALSVY